MLRREQAAALYAAMDRLPSDYREVLKLVYIDGLSQAEARARMEKSPPQVNNLLYRGKAALKKLLESNGFHE